MATVEGVGGEVGMTSSDRCIKPPPPVVFRISIATLPDCLKIHGGYAPDIDTLALALRTNLPLTKRPQPKALTPAELRLRSYTLLSGETQVKEVSWIEEPPHAQHRSHPLQAKAISTTCHPSSQRTDRDRSTQRSKSASNPPTDLWPPFPQRLSTCQCKYLISKFQSVMTNKPFWNFDETLVYADISQHPNIGLSDRNACCQITPLPGGIMRQHLIDGPRFHATALHLRSLQPAPRPRPESAGQLPAWPPDHPAQYRFHERYLHPIMGFDLQAVIIKGVEYEPLLHPQRG
ncbi:hypothetical protein CLCR_02513 [Cladophialophora carrionii]|uniref:Uncharacterized protein n=1 Tax=Cladophialophora carrionii TaxID=86049 RepID=A0A1C1CFC2_9EURO|nr:hypothetical protein CLCR_02513 [Cladophialophora carrionii]